MAYMCLNKTGTECNGCQECNNFESTEKGLFYCESCEKLLQICDISNGYRSCNHCGSSDISEPDESELCEIIEYKNNRIKELEGKARG